MTAVRRRSQDLPALTSARASHRLQYCSTLRQGAVATKERFTVNIDADQLERLQTLAEQHGVSMAWLGRQAIARFLADHGPHPELPFPPVHATPRKRDRSV